MEDLIAPGINIFSGERGLGAALTNPTELAKRKGMLSTSFAIVFDGKRYPDVETAYHLLANKPDMPATDTLMAELIACKFRQHPSLAKEVASKGGVAWLRRCDHLTGARSDSAQSWEGHGQASRFIRNLARGYEMAQAPEVIENNQHQLF